jgi:exonuclease SbcC
MPSWSPSAVQSREQLASQLRQAFDPLGAELETPDAAPVPTLLLRFKQELAAFAVASGDPRRDYKAAYEYFKDMYEKQYVAWDNFNLSFVLCMLHEMHDKETEDLCRDVESNIFFCRKFVVFLDGKVGYGIARLPFVPLKHDVGGILRPPSAQSVLKSYGLSGAFADAIVLPQRRSAETIVEDCLDGKFGTPDLARTSTPEFREPTIAAHAVRLQSIEIENFRAYRKRTVLDLSGDIVLLYGPNGLGKTSLYDAIDFAATGGIGRLSIPDKAFRKVARHLDSGKTEQSVVALSMRANGVDRRIVRTVDGHAEPVLDGKPVNRKAALGAITGSDFSSASDRIENMVSLFRATHLFSQELPLLAQTFRDSSELSSEVISRLLAFEDFVNARRKVDGVVGALGSEIKMRKERSSTIREFLAKERAELAKLQSAQTSSHDVGVLNERIEKLRVDIKAAGIQIGDGSSKDTNEARSWRAMLEAEVSRIAGVTEKLGELLSAHPKVAALRSQIDQNEKILEAKRPELRAIDAKLLPNQSRMLAIKSEVQDVERKLAALEKERGHLSWWRTVLPDLQMTVQQLNGLRVNQSQVASGVSSARGKYEELQRSVREAESRAAKLASERESIQAVAAQIDHLISKYEYFRQLSVNRASTELTVHRLGVELGQIQPKLQAAKGRRHELQTKLEKAASEFTKVQKDISELGALLDALEVHVTSGICPACGEDHGTVENLLSKMRKLRAFTASESKVAGVLRELTGDLEAADREVKEVEAIQASCDQQMKSASTEVERLSKEIASIASLATEAGVELEGRDAMSLLQQRRTTIGGQARANDTDLANANAQVGGIAKLVSSAHADLKLLEKQLEAHGEAIAVRQARLEKLKADGVLRGITLDDPSPSIEDRHARVESESGRLRSLLADRTQQLSDISQEVTRGQSALASNKQAVESMEKSLLEARRVLQDWERDAVLGGIAAGATNEELNAHLKRNLARATWVEELKARTLDMENALDAAATSATVEIRQKAIRDFEKELESIGTAKEEKWLDFFASIGTVLRDVQEVAVRDYTSRFGPLSAIIQQRLRSVFGFEGVELRAVDGAIQVRVTRNGEVLRPTDYFSQSQQQILMLSLFFTACSTQNWSSFAPVLLDDPITHFDDLNAYAFLDLIAGLSETGEKRQFIVSTCEERFFNLARQKLGHFGDRLKVYEYRALGTDGPIIETAVSNAIAQSGSIDPSTRH